MRTNTFGCILFVAIVFFGSVADAAGQSKGKKSSGSGALVERGKYLVNLGGCGDCHTPKIMTDKGPVEDTTRTLSGQPGDEKIADIPAGALSPKGWIAMTNAHLSAWAGPWGVSFARNLTPDKTTGLGTWTEQMFMKALRTGKDMGEGRDILPPMPWEKVGKLKDEDLHAIFAYLQSLKPVHNAVPDPIPPQMQQTK